MKILYELDLFFLQLWNFHIKIVINNKKYKVKGVVEWGQSRTECIVLLKIVDNIGNNKTCKNDLQNFKSNWRKVEDFTEFSQKPSTFFVKIAIFAQIVQFCVKSQIKCEILRNWMKI